VRIVHQLVALVRALFRSRRIDSDLAAEMRFHVDRDIQANIARGMAPDAARRAAHLAFGSVDALQEQSRDERPGAGFREIVRDMRYGSRLLRKSPGFALTAIAIVALGIGAATAVFTVAYGVMLRPFPFREPERLVSIWASADQSGTRLFPPTAADVVDLRQLDRAFDGVALLRATNLNLAGDGEPQRLAGVRVSSNLFSVLGVPAILGRTFRPEEDKAGRDQVVVLSYALWRGRFGADSSIIGRQLQLSGAPYTVIGIAPPGFQYPWSGLDAWVPNVVEPDELTRAATQNYRVVARLHPRATLESARIEARQLASRLGRVGPMNAPGTFNVDSVLDDAVRQVRPALKLVLGAVVFLLALAAVNLSNLFGAKATSRRGEFAVRLALGASRKRIVVQAMAESVPVLALGGVVGVMVATWAVRAFVASAPAGMPRIENIAVSIPVLLVSLALLMLIGFGASIAPAVQAWRSDFTTVTKDGGRSSTVGRTRSRARRIGVAAQVAFAVPLLVGATLLVRSALAVSQVDLGFVPDRVATMSFEVSRRDLETDQQVSDYYTRIVDAARAVPGVSSAAIGNRVPLLGGQSNTVWFDTPAAPSPDGTEVDSRPVTPEYFTTLGIKLLAGRIFTEHDDAASPFVAIVDDRIARTIWPGESPIGKRFRGPGDREGTIIGVVGHVRTATLESDPRAQMYWSHRQWVQNRAVLAVRTQGDPRAVFPAVIAAVHSVNPNQSVYEVRTMPEIVDRSLVQRRLTTYLLVGFGSVALILAAVGIYGVVAYSVSQRMREFGIRVALGATRREVTRLVVGQGTTMALAGAAVGLTIAMFGARIMSSLVYGVEPRDAVSMVAASALLLAVAALASYIPSRRAAGADPGLTLRAD
jgi:putative ABC transport system permease protein